jgi:hypothetical protein
VRRRKFEFSTSCKSNGNTLYENITLVIDIICTILKSHVENSAENADYLAQENFKVLHFQTLLGEVRTQKKCVESINPSVM